MNVGLIIDQKPNTMCSFFCKDGIPFSFKNKLPYEKEDGNGIRNVFNVVFPFDGIHVNWDEGLMDIDFDIIFLVIECFYKDRTIDVIRKKYPNAILIGYCKEYIPFLSNSDRAIDFFNKCDRIATPYDYDVVKFMEKMVNKKVYTMPYPYDINKGNFLIKKEKRIICGCSRVRRSGDRGYRDSLSFSRYLATKYKFDLIESPDYSYNEWLDVLSSSEICINLEKQPRIGQVPIDCAIMRTLHLGGTSNGSKQLWMETSTNDTKVLEKIICSDYKEILANAYKRVVNIHSFSSAIDNLDKIIKNS